MNRFLTQKILLLAALIFCCVTILAQDEIHQSYPLNSDGIISLTNTSGNIRITGWNENRVQVDAVKQGDRNNFSQVEITIANSPEKIEIKTNYPRGGWRRNFNVEVSYELKVPRAAILNPITCTSGNITITGAGSKIFTRATSGEVIARNIPGDAELRTTSGNINAEQITGALSAHSTSGSLKVLSVGGFNGQATSGDVIVTDVRGDASVTATSGDIRAEKIKGRVSLRALSGKVSVRDADGDARLDCISDSIIAENIKGRVTATSVSANMTFQNIGEGVRINSVNGTISISRTKGLIEAQSTSSDINLFNVDSHEVKINCHSGAIKFDGPIYDDGRYTFESFSGSIHLIIPGNSNFTVAAKTFNGSLETDFPIKLPPGVIQTGRQKQLQGSHGQTPGAQITANGFSADISLKKK